MQAEITPETKAPICKGKGHYIPEYTTYKGVNLHLSIFLHNLMMYC